MRYWSAAKAQDQMEEQLVALFASDGMELDPDIISQDAPPSSLSLSRDLDREQAAAAFFLGSDMAQGDQSGDTYTYSSKLGAARFRSNGGFDIVGTLSDADGEELCRRFCKDFSYSEPVFILDESGSGSATAVVAATGNNTYFGSMAKALSGDRAKNSFEQGVDSVSRLLLRFMLIMVPIRMNTRAMRV